MVDYIMNHHFSILYFYIFVLYMNLKYIGAVCLLALFIGSSINKFTNFESTANMLSQKYGFNLMPKIISQVAIALAIALLLVGTLYVLKTIYMKRESS